MLSCINNLSPCVITHFDHNCAKEKHFRLMSEFNHFKTFFPFMTDPFITKDDLPKFFKRNTLRHFSFSTELLRKIKKNDIIRFQ